MLREGFLVHRSAPEIVDLDHESRKRQDEGSKRLLRTNEGLSPSKACVDCGRLMHQFRCRRKTIGVVLAFATTLRLINCGEMYRTYSGRALDFAFSSVAASPSTFQQRPLMLQLTEDDLNVTRLQLKSKPTPLVQDRRNRYWINHGADWYESRSKRKEGCVALGDWQDSHHPSCQFFHEIAMNSFNDESQREQIRLVGSGAYRHAWMVREYNGAKVALKTLAFSENRIFDKLSFDQHRRDAVAMEQLSASPYIVDVYGYCSNSAIVEYADAGTLEEVFKSKPTKNELLKIAYDVTVAVADAHHLDRKGRATIAHTDLQPDQFVLINGIYKLNDFNRAKFLSWDTERGEHCGFYFYKQGGRWRSPEEYRYDAETEKIDVFSHGHVLYFLLTGKEPFAKYNRTEVPDLVMEGEVPKITNKNILESKHPFDTTLRKAMKMCWTFDPKKRPGAREVANFIHKALERL